MALGGPGQRLFSSPGQTSHRTWGLCMQRTRSAAKNTLSLQLSPPEGPGKQTWPKSGSRGPLCSRCVPRVSSSVARFFLLAVLGLYLHSSQAASLPPSQPPLPHIQDNPHGCCCDLFLAICTHHVLYRADCAGERESALCVFSLVNVSCAVQAVLPTGMFISLL